MCPPLPSLAPRLPPLLPGQFFSSSRRQSAVVFRLLLPQRAGLKRSAWELSLSLSLSHPCLSLHTVMREQLCGRQRRCVAIQEALILLLCASSALSSFIQDSLFLSFYVSLSFSLCQSCLLLPPISSPLIDSSFRLLFVHALSAARLLFLVPFFLSHLYSFSSSLQKAGTRYVSPFTYSQKKKGLVLAGLLVWSVVFPSFFFSSTVFCLVLPGCPVSLAGACVGSSRLRQAEQ